LRAAIRRRQMSTCPARKANSFSVRLMGG
jgi:hypothetical protein